VGDLEIDPAATFALVVKVHDHDETRTERR
jgi:hypothetical protein